MYILRDNIKKSKTIQMKFSVVSSEINIFILHGQVFVTVALKHKLMISVIHVSEPDVLCVGPGQTEWREIVCLWTWYTIWKYIV